MHEVTLESWKDFYVALAGAASALAGLVFVALSINLARILAIPGLTARGGETIILLSAALLAALIGLIPGQSLQTIGLELGVVGLIAWCAPVAFQITAGRAKYYQTRSQLVHRVIFHQAATVPLLLASALMLSGRDGGFGWLALGVILALVAGLQNAWVLLVEILR